MNEKQCRAVLGLGANLGDRRENLAAALEALDRLPGTAMLKTSSILETEPFDVPDEQPNYLNCCVLLETALSPRALLGACLGIEAALGRVRKIRHGARVIDIDLLLYEGETSDDPELRLPHPGILERDFVLLPLKELFPDGIALGFHF